MGAVAIGTGWKGIRTRREARGVSGHAPEEEIKRETRCDGNGIIIISLLDCQHDVP
jgi:hypothetical protein